MLILCTKHEISSKQQLKFRMHTLPSERSSQTILQVFTCNHIFRQSEDDYNCPVLYSTQDATYLLPRLRTTIHQTATYSSLSSTITTSRHTTNSFQKHEI